MRSSVDLVTVCDKGFPKDPTLGVHVSNHNAFKMEGEAYRLRNGHWEQWAQVRRRELEELDLHYAKVCKRYQKKNKSSETPKREDDAYVYSAYGYPMYFPIYMPYYADPSSGDQHSTTHSSGGGGCAAGTCTASASMGSCSGGEGTPSCSASCGGHGDVDAGCGSCGGGGGGCGGCGG